MCFKFQLCIRISMQLTLQELLKFVALFAIMNVGADIIRPRREILRIRISFRRKCNILLHNPSVSFADSSLYTREPWRCRASTTNINLQA